MFVHTVYFWLKPGLPREDVERFERELLSLTKLGSVQHGWIGKPAATDRPVIDRTYSYGLTVVFKDEAGHDAYQVDRGHDAFRENCSKYWNAVKIYDFE